MEQSNLTGGPATRAGISLPENLMQATRERAAQEERPFSWVVRRALLAYLAGCERETKPKPQTS